MAGWCLSRGVRWRPCPGEWGFLFCYWCWQLDCELWQCCVCVCFCFFTTVDMAGWCLSGGVGVGVRWRPCPGEWGFLFCYWCWQQAQLWVMVVLCFLFCFTPVDMACDVWTRGRDGDLVLMNRGVCRRQCVAKFCLHPSSSAGCAGIVCSVETRKLPHSVGF